MNSKESKIAECAQLDVQQTTYKVKIREFMLEKKMQKFVGHILGRPKLFCKIDRTRLKHRAA